MTIRADVQQFEVNDVVELFELYVPYTDSTYYFCSSLVHGTSVEYSNNGAGIHSYTPIPIEASGYELSGRGTLPQPKVRVADVTGVISQLVRNNYDLVGCTFTRIRTLRKYLTDPTTKFADEVYYVSRKSSQDSIFTEFTLSPALDLQGIQLPKKLVLKNYCSFTYRRWNSVTMGFDAGTCPYAGTSYFDIGGTACTQENDKCGKKVSDCKLRYPTPEVLPTTAYPGVYDVRR